MLKDRNFDALERRLGDIQRAYEADTEKEFSMNDAFAQLAVPDPDLEKVFEEWVSSHPSSYVANTAAGAYYLDMAGAWRGTKFIAGTPQWKLDRMGRYVEKAGQSLKRSLAMSQKPTLSYALLIRAARLNGIVKESAQWLYEAITRDPHCVLPRNAHMAQLEPRWGGSYGAMQEFADETGKEQHPKLKKAAAKYQGWVQWYRGVELSWNNDYVEALKYFNSALARAEDTKFLVDRAGLYKDIGQTGLAMADVDRALELAPHNLQASYLKSMMLLDKHQVEEGMKGLLRLARMSDHDAMTQLGYIYKDGAHGIPINLAESIFWLKKVAYFGDDYACFQLGGMYSHGEGVPVDMKAAVEYFKVAASLGNALAMNDLGLMYWHGKGVPVDHRTATELWVKASDKGAWQANHNLRFFLRPHELILLAMYHPQIILKIKSLLWLILASMALVLLLTHMIIKNIKKRQSEKNMDFQFTDKLK
jgi:TPR repeat protein